jgi:hypothetical protein
MKQKEWQKFAVAREHFKNIVKNLRNELPELADYQRELVNHRDGPAYSIDMPVVYNRDLDAINPRSIIKLILVADNPGRREQSAENLRYLVGPSGKIAEKFFREHPELEIDFRTNVLILNKTPIHTPRTAELAELYRFEHEQQKKNTIQKAVEASQKDMAELLLEFHKALSPIPVWIIGYSEMKKKGIFEVYTRTLQQLYAGLPRRKQEIFLFRHFSMNQFTIDLNKQKLPEETAETALKRIGTAYRTRILDE